MNAKDVGLKIVEGTEQNALLTYLGIKHGQVEITGVAEEGEKPPRYMYYKRDDLNGIVGLAALYHGLDIVAVGTPFIEANVRGLPAGIAQIAERVRDRKLDVPDMGGYGFGVKSSKNKRHGHFLGPFNTKSARIHSFEDAFGILFRDDNIPASVATRLLQFVLSADLPITTPQPENFGVPDMIAFIRSGG